MNQKRGENITADGAYIAFWRDDEDPNLIHFGQGADDRITLTLFQAKCIALQIQDMKQSEKGK